MKTPPTIAAAPWPLATLTFPTDPRESDWQLLWGYIKATIPAPAIKRPSGKLEPFHFYTAPDFRPARFLPDKIQIIERFKAPKQKVVNAANLTPVPTYASTDAEGNPVGEPTAWSITCHVHPDVIALLESTEPSMVLPLIQTITVNIEPTET
jgi:hypothetical protein